MLKVIQAKNPHFFHEELVQNHLSEGQTPWGCFSPAWGGAGAQVLQPWIQEAEIPTSVSTTLFQRPEMQIG